MAWTLSFLIWLIVAVHCAPQDGDLDSLIDGVFNKNDQPNLNPSSSTEGTACTQENGQRGECVQYYLCNANNSIITDGVGLIDIRINEEAACESYLEVCCGSPDITTTPILPPPKPTPNTQTGPGTVPGTDNNGQNGLSGCGQRNPDGVGFRIKGDNDNEAAFGEFPWMVAILREEPVASSGQKLNVYICGGSLIHPKVVLTAAHCVAAKSGAGGPKLKVRAGEWDTQTKNEIFAHQDRNVVKIVSHQQYYAGALYNDIALLILESPVTYAENIGVVCLPPINSNPPNARCYASGWGKDVFGKEGKYQVILKRVDLPIVDRKKCQADLRKTRLGNKFELHRSFICAGGEKGKDTCKGDGGSPLVCPMPQNPNKYIQSGIVAWGIGCGEGSTPGVYVHVAHLREWIDEQLIYNNIDMTSFAA